jgi:ribosomal protein L15
MSDAKSKSGTAKAVSRGGHPSSGGHFGKATPGRALRQNNNPMSRLNRSRWDYDPGSNGGEMPYQFQEYPKHVYPNPHKLKEYVVVNSEDEERLALRGEEIVREDEERKRLVTLAEVNHVQVDKRWGIHKLTKALDDAGFDSSANPFV